MSIDLANAVKGFFLGSTKGLSTKSIVAGTLKNTGETDVFGSAMEKDGSFGDAFNACSKHGISSIFTADELTNTSSGMRQGNSVGVVGDIFNNIKNDI